MKNLVYANGPARARQVVSWVRALARRIPMDVTVQRVDGGSRPKEEAVSLLREELAGVEGVRSVSLSSRPGAPEEIIAAEVRERAYGLVTLAPAGRQGLSRLFRGSMVGHVVQRVSTSILVVREGRRVPPRRILVGVAGARHSLTTVSLAAQVAGLFDSDLTLLLVLSQVGIGMAGGEPWDADPSSFLQSDHPLAGHLRVASQIAARSGRPPRVQVRQGLVCTEILREIRQQDHDLLVIGTHRAEDFDTVYEDLTDELVKTSPASTLVAGIRAELL